MSIKPWLITLLAFASALASPLSANPRQDEVFLDAGRRQVEFAATAEPHRSSGGACAAIAAECLVAPKATKPRGGDTPAAQRGREAHKDFAEKVKQKPGWESEKTITGPNGEKLRPDAIDPKGRPVELKPNTPSGRAQGQKQIQKYKDATGTNGRVTYYDP